MAYLEIRTNFALKLGESMIVFSDKLGKLGQYYQNTKSNRNKFKQILLLLNQKM